MIYRGESEHWFRKLSFSSPIFSNGNREQQIVPRRNCITFPFSTFLTFYFDMIFNFLNQEPENIILPLNWYITVVEIIGIMHIIVLRCKYKINDESCYSWASTLISSVTYISFKCPLNCWVIELRFQFLLSVPKIK